MRNVQILFAVGDAVPGGYLAAYGPDTQGDLDTENPVESGYAAIHEPDVELGWLEGAHLSGEWPGPMRSAGWCEASWQEQAWMEEVAEIPVAVGSYEYGALEFGGKIVDRIGRTSDMSDALTVLVNAQPPMLRESVLSVASDVVTMAIALNME